MQQVKVWKHLEKQHSEWLHSKPNNSRGLTPERGWCLLNGSAVSCLKWGKPHNFCTFLCCSVSAKAVRVIGGREEKDLCKPSFANVSVGFSGLLFQMKLLHSCRKKKKVKYHVTKMYFLLIDLFLWLELIPSQKK